MKYAGKEYPLKFDNLAAFRLAVAGANMSELLITPKSEPAQFCRAWAALLGVPFDGDERKFFEGFGKEFNVYALNDEVLAALERDGVLEPPASAKKKKPARKR